MCLFTICSPTYLHLYVIDSPQRWTHGQTDRQTYIHPLECEIFCGSRFDIYFVDTIMRFLMSFATNYQPATTSSRQSTTNNTLSLWSTWNPTEGHGRTFIEVVTVVWHYFTDTEVVCQQDCRRMWAIWGIIAVSERGASWNIFSESEC